MIIEHPVDNINEFAVELSGAVVLPSWKGGRSISVNSDIWQISADEERSWYGIRFSFLPRVHHRVIYDDKIHHDYDEGHFDPNAYLIEQLEFLAGVVRGKYKTPIRTFIDRSNGILFVESFWSAYRRQREADINVGIGS